MTLCSTLWVTEILPRPSPPGTGAFFIVLLLMDVQGKAKRMGVLLDSERLGLLEKTV